MFVEAVAKDDVSDAVVAPNDSFDTLITGYGADVIKISYINASGAGAAIGLFGTVTDFDNTEDMTLTEDSIAFGAVDPDAASFNRAGIEI
ncbi:hypothetical protein [Tateyamaria sp.]|uniref:hypothetical protein n=1 Tax=Tateyamaria sp. TaxID=1929288 RepID=UPI00329F3843